MEGAQEPGKDDSTGTHRAYDVVSLGEPLLRLSPPRFQQLRRAASLDAIVVGSQLNVAANLARLGKRSALLTRLPDQPLGWLALDACRGYGIDVSHVQMLPQGKMGVTYVEFSAAPRAPVAVYDRTGSAASTIGADDFDWDAILEQSAVAYTDGIFPGLSASCREATRAFLTAARRQACITCFDVNYREHLWTPDDARRAWSEILPLVDVVATNRGVSEAVFGFRGDDEEIARQYADGFGCRVCCLTSRELRGLARGAWESLAWSDGQAVRGERQEFEIVDRYGTGDAWLAGFLYGHLEWPADLASALDFGNALCAMAHTIEGDVVHVTAEQVLAIMGDEPDLCLKR